MRLLARLRLYLVSEAETIVTATVVLAVRLSAAAAADHLLSPLLERGRVLFDCRRILQKQLQRLGHYSH